jgi:hypothetical protein
LTDELADAPHTETVFERFVKVGRLITPALSIGEEEKD